MSFFIKGKVKHSIPRPKYEKNKAKRKKLVKATQDELTSSSEDELRINQEEQSESSDNENETAQDKKLRLAKIYLQEIERKEKEKYENDEHFNDDAIAKVLKEDYLRSAGTLRTTLASKYIGADLDNIKVFKCKDHRSSLTCLCLTSKFLFSGSKDGCIVKWSIEDCKKVDGIPYTKQHVASKKITGHMKGIISLAISADDKFLAASDKTKDIQIWDPNTLNHINTLKGHQATVTGLVFRKTTHTLYSCSQDRSIKIWSLDEMAYVETLYGHQTHITSIDALSRERAVTSGGMDGTIRIWKIVEESQLIYNSPSAIDIVKLINEETFASGGDDGTINIWGVNKKKPLCSFRNAHGCNTSNSEPHWICSIAVLVNTDLIATGSCDGFIKLWKLGNNCRSINLLFTVEMCGFINSMTFTEDGKFLIAAVGNEHRMGRWNVIKSVTNSIVKIPLLQSTNRK